MFVADPRTVRLCANRGLRATLSYPVPHHRWPGLQPVPRADRVSSSCIACGLLA